MARDLDAGAGGIGLPAPLWPSAFESVHEWLQHLEWQYQHIVGVSGRGGRLGMGLRGKPVIAGGGPSIDGRDSLFWHLITSGGKYQRQRLMDLGRGARIGQAWHLLELLDAGDPRCVWWRQGRRVLIAPADFSLVVVLKESTSSFVLITFYPQSKGPAQRRLFRLAAASWERGESSWSDPPGLPARRRVRRDRPPAAGWRYRRQFTGWPLAWDYATA